MLVFGYFNSMVKKERFGFESWDTCKYYKGRKPGVILDEEGILGYCMKRQRKVAVLSKF